MSQERVNWVKKRGECTPELALLALSHVIEQDVKDLNALPAKRRKDRTYEVVKSEGQEGGFSSVQVRPQESTGSFNTAIFQVEEGGIRIDAYPHSTMYVTVGWEAESVECRYWLEKQIFEAWELSRKALEGIFFGS